MLQTESILQLTLITYEQDGGPLVLHNINARSRRCDQRVLFIENDEGHESHYFCRIIWLSSKPDHVILMVDDESIYWSSLWRLYVMIFYGVYQ